MAEKTPIPAHTYHPGSLYPEDKFSLARLIKGVISRVRMTDQSVEAVKRQGNTGIVVYALKEKSQLNSLILKDLATKNGFPQPAYSHGVNMIFWQPVPVAIRTLLSYLFKLFFHRAQSKMPQRTLLQRLTLEGKSTIIPLGETEFIEDPSADEALAEFIECQQAISQPIAIVPILITYGRRREREQETVINILFGQTEHTGAFRRIITFLRYANKIAVIAAEALPLPEFIKTHSDLSPKALRRQLRRELIERIDEEKTSIVGPILKTREAFINLVLQDEDLARLMKDMAEEERTAYEAVTRRARKYLEEIAGDYNETYIEFWDKFLTWLWNNIYDGLIADRDGLEKVRILSKKMPFVVIPCHRSHIDYLVLSYVLYKHNLQLPFIAAGTNLLFWPLGHIFRKSGAFFMRRTFKGNLLYGEVFAKYLKMLLKEEMPLEFFIEGGRSRTGKMIMPKYGLLSMIIQAYKDKACENLALVPVYIGYDRVIEEKSYLKELSGAAKETEKTSDVIKSGKVLRKRYGHVYVNIGEPLLLNSYLNAQPKAYEDMGVEERQSLYRKIGYEVVLEISKVSVVTPFSLLAAGFLSHDRRGISHSDLMMVVQAFFQYLSYKNVRFASSFSDRGKALQDGIALFMESGFMSRVGEEDEINELEEAVYSLDEEKRLHLEYYKNNILHFFLPISFLAILILSRREDTIALQDIMEDYMFFKKLFRHEFIFDDHISDADEVSSLLAYLRTEGMIRLDPQDQLPHIEVTGTGRANLMPFAGLVQNYIESYWVVIRGCLHLKKEARSEKDLLKYIRELGAKMYNKGEIRRSEALSQANYENALRFLQDMEILSMSEAQEKGDKRPTRDYRLTENREPLESIRRRIFKFL